MRMAQGRNFCLLATNIFRPNPSLAAYTCELNLVEHGDQLEKLIIWVLQEIYLALQTFTSDKILAAPDSYNLKKWKDHMHTTRLEIFPYHSSSDEMRIVESVNE